MEVKTSNRKKIRDLGGLKENKGPSKERVRRKVQNPRQKMIQKSHNLSRKIRCLSRCKDEQKILLGVKRSNKNRSLNCRTSKAN